MAKIIPLSDYKNITHHKVRDHYTHGYWMISAILCLTVGCCMIVIYYAGKNVKLDAVSLFYMSVIQLLIIGSYSFYKFWKLTK